MKESMWPVARVWSQMLQIISQIMFPFIIMMVKRQICHVSPTMIA